ncbi:hypothetical protein OAA86_03515 [Rhodospirillales bacterium]|jgi:hypothetical protein|nr:hypothetical protein [Rhodospirillales bacterium]
MLKRTQRAIQRGGIILFAAFIGIALLAGVGAYLLNGSSKNSSSSKPNEKPRPGLNTLAQHSRV